MKCCICGPVRNCAKFLQKVLENVESIGNLFEDYTILLVYDKSTDNTLDILKEYTNKNPKMKLYINRSFVSKYRTHRLAYARNLCVNYVKSQSQEYPLFIMMDFDDVNCKDLNVNVLTKYLNRTDWDALSFNTVPRYYDIWALSIYPYCFSYNHFENTPKHNYDVIQNYIEKKLKRLKPGELLRCISAFNGFAIYRTEKFMGGSYDGNVRADLLPAHYLKAHENASQSKLIYYDYGHVKGKYEDCEHRAFHIQAINESNAKIMISPDVLFS